MRFLRCWQFQLTPRYAGLYFCCTYCRYRFIVYVRYSNLISQLVQNLCPHVKYVSDEDMCHLHQTSFGAFEKLRKASSLPSVRPHGTTRIHLTDFYEIWYLSIFRNSVTKIQVSLKSDKNNGYFTWRPIYIYDHFSLNSSSNEKCSEKCWTEN